MNQIGISRCGGSVSFEERKRSSDLSLSEEEPPHQKKRSSSLHQKKQSYNFSLSEEQLHKIYDVEPQPVYPDDDDFVPTEKPTHRFVVVCKVCECPVFVRSFRPSFCVGEESTDSLLLQLHAGEHIEFDFIDCDGTRLRKEIPVKMGYRRECEYCGCGYKRCGSGAYVAAVLDCVHCCQTCIHSSEDCPFKGDWRPSSPCCPPRKIDD